jgi:hypothetical protein
LEFASLLPPNIAIIMALGSIRNSQGCSVSTELDLSLLGVPIARPGQPGMVCLLNASTTPGKTAARTLLIGEFRGKTPATELENCLQHAPHSAIAIRADEVEGDTPEQKGSALLAIIEDLIKKHLTDGETEICIDLHGEEVEGRLLLVSSDGALSVPADELLAAMKRGPADAASTGCVTFLSCQTKVIHGQVKNHPHDFLFLSGHRNVKEMDTIATMKEQIRFSTSHAMPTAAEDLWRHAALTSGENPTLAGKGRMKTIRLLDLPASELADRPGQLAKLFIAKLGHGGINTVAGLLLDHRELLIDDVHTALLFHLIDTKCDFAEVKLPLLLCLGWDVNTARGAGETLLHAACKKGDITLIECLLEYGADSTVLDQNGLTPQDVARAHDQTDVLTVFSAFEAGIRFEQYSPTSLVSLLGEFGYTRAVELLQKTGIERSPDNRSGNNESGKTTLDISSDRAASDRNASDDDGDEPDSDSEPDSSH